MTIWRLRLAARPGWSGIERACTVRNGAAGVNGQPRDTANGGHADLIPTAALLFLILKHQLEVFDESQRGRIIDGSAASMPGHLIESRARSERPKSWHKALPA